MSDWSTSWAARLGFATDRLLNVLLFDGSDTQTVSLHAAQAEQGGKRWACWTCWVLARLVQRRHCALTLDPDVQETPGAGIRAGLLMLGGAGAVITFFHFARRAFRSEA